MEMGHLPSKVDYSVEVNPSSVFSVDLDGDRDNDLAVANGGSFHWPGNTVSVFLNNGDGTLQLMWTILSAVIPKQYAVWI